MARWFSWLECRPVTAEVVGSSPIRVAICGNSSVVEHLLAKDFFVVIEVLAVIPELN